jgi:hypothetical protein
MKQRCVIEVGRLIGHPCARSTDLTCTSCGFPVCAAHLSGSVCVVCAGEHAPVRGTTSVELEEMLSFDGAEVAAFDEQGDNALHDYES